MGEDRVTNLTKISKIKRMNHFWNKCYQTGKLIATYILLSQDHFKQVTRKVKACVILTTMNPIITVAAILSETVQKSK
jgi:hypothetical protein